MENFIFKKDQAAINAARLIFLLCLYLPKLSFYLRIYPNMNIHKMFGRIVKKA